MAWNAKPTRRRGGQRKYSDVAIETALTLRMLLHLPLRQTEGFLRSIFELMNLTLDVPDHTTLSRRNPRLSVQLRSHSRTRAINLVIDTSGLSIFGEGQWAAVKHGGNGIQGWRKLHLGVDQTGVIVAQALTSSTVDDAATGIDAAHARATPLIHRRDWGGEVYAFRLLPVMRVVYQD